MDNPYVVPGLSLHAELEYLVQAGFTPYEAIEAGTRNVAEALGRLDEFGTVAEGKRADLILVDKNPLEDVANVGKRTGVMLRGTWLPETRLRGMLGELVELYLPGRAEQSRIEHQASGQDKRSLCLAFTTTTNSGGTTKRGSGITTPTATGD